ncbi:MAG: hypothetical protein K2X61_14915, partial [Caulobacteraceae bacterium]|nr:hypothetical protein [Caulobacteraceae bacterium]
TASVNSAISTATLDLQSYADAAVASGTAGLATVSQLDTAVAGALVTAQSYVDAYEATATATFATIATVNGISGSVTTLQSSVVTIEGQIELTYGFALNAGGRVTGMRAVATNDLTTIDFEADAFRIWSGTANVPAFAVVDGAVYVAGNRVNTTSLVANAVTNGASARTTGATTVTTEAQVQSCAITTAGGRVRVDFSAQLVASAATPTDVTARVTRNGTQVWSGVIGRMNGESRYPVVIGGSTSVDDYVDIPGALNAEGGAFFIDAGVADTPGTYTYALLVTCTAGVEVSERNVALLEIKR